MREKIHKVNKITALLLVLIFTLGLAVPCLGRGRVGFDGQQQRADHL